MTRFRSLIKDEASAEKLQSQAALLNNLLLTAEQNCPARSFPQLRLSPAP